ncbi:3-methyl-2-oxobutanoate hydroxymethyltransferase [Sphingomonas sp. MAH-20]|uniref:3-methyl-2-oxobutanoate hydroxymethyltransferase n=1 Tax=Sphingomonas horti TaxID=2682842 RepID=A0A6I4J3L9_9SPHN|nr:MULTISPECIES: 3-methyl-2-oxobutanoate hydroxymethyltransferase [Sphingomonas]MBA2919217.1 3-methyl-2-oxobutanoate hydroxymethyltransferase [Sphingomonas sp. CGMCC 1.13658]MVO79250.1 3-methyl-2-oxobutanoate hydroxymethyltransferase [Sphingomonas horti]
MSTFTIDTATSRAHPTPAPMKRLTVPAVRARKGGEPLVMLTAYTVRMAQLLDPHCDILLVGDSLGQVIYGLPSTLPVTLDMMCAHGAAVVRGSYHALVIVDMPFGSYEASPDQAFASAARILAETGAAGVKLEGGETMAPTIAFLTARGVPVMAHVGLTPQSVNALGGYGARGRTNEEHSRIVADARAVAEAGAFSVVAEGVIEPLARTIAAEVACPVIGIGASAACDGQVLVAEDMLGLFERTPRFVKRYADMAGMIGDAAAAYAAEVRARTFPGPDQVYAPK